MASLGAHSSTPRKEEEEEGEEEETSSLSSSQFVYGNLDLFNESVSSCHSCSASGCRTRSARNLDFWETTSGHVSKFCALFVSKVDTCTCVSPRGLRTSFKVDLDFEVVFSVSGSSLFGV